VRFERQGQSRERKFTLLLALITTAITIITSSPSGYAADREGVCAPVIGRVVSLQGTIEAQRAGATTWARLTVLDTPVCDGDRLRAGPSSRAAVFIQPENLIRLDQNTELSFRQTTDETFLEFFQDVAVAPEALSQGCGAGYVITRFPRNFRIRTPHVNAAVEGTEFLVALRCDVTELAVFEGKVRAQSVASTEEQLLSSGQLLAAGATEPAAIRLLVKPADAVQWALYYPPLSDAGIAVPGADECQQLPQGAIRQICFAQRAEHFLRLGRVDQAEAEISEALAEPQVTGEALAVRTIIDVVKNDKAAALANGEKATAASPDSSRAWLAVSYAQQANFKLEDATKSVQRAAELSPDSSLVQARLAEMYMSLGRTRDAEKAARRAVEANPDEERAHTVLGFVHLAQIKIKEAKADFLAAIERDSTAPLPRLGLGLATIRQGDLVPGREQLEIAVALDPTNSLLRSYVGKAYYEENTKERDQLAAAQFELAKQLDPNDPTPWFYQGILEQAVGNSVFSLLEYQESIKRNDNLAVQRSKLLLDADLAARTASVARSYQDLGYSQLSLLDGWKAIDIGPDNYSGHRMLSDSLSILPRHEIARLSELRQSQLRQPVSASLIPPQLSEDQLFILQGAGPALPGSSDFNQLFVRNQSALRLDGLAGNFGTIGDQVTASAIYDHFAFGIGQFHYETDGLTPVSALQRDIWNVFVQGDLSLDTGVQAEIRRSSGEREDLLFEFDPANAFPQETTVQSDSVRLGVRHRLASHVDVIASVENRKDDETFSFPLFGLENTGISRGTTVEIQSLGRHRAASVILGASGFEGDTHGVFNFVPFDQERSHGNLYAYATGTVPALFTRITLGISVDRMDEPDFDREETNPKIGIVWSHNDTTIVRAAYFQTVQRQLLSNQTLEPTHVAGFNQFFDDGTNGAISRRYGFGIDQRFHGPHYVGAEVTTRQVLQPLILAPEVVRDLRHREYSHRAYWYWPLSQNFSTSLEYFYEDLSSPPDETGPSFASALTTHRAAAGIRIFNPFRYAGAAVRVAQNYIHQEATFQGFSGEIPQHDSFWLTDIGVDVRLRRMAILSIEVRNLFDQQFAFQDVDPENPRFAARRFVFARANLSF
jgi:tetratricopeptide (TPR) repeat protein